MACYHVLIGIGAAVTRRPLPHHRAYGSVHGDSSWLALTLLDQRWKSERPEIGIGKPPREGLGPGQIPRAMSAARGVAREPRRNPQREQSRSAATRCFPLPPQSGP